MDPGKLSVVDLASATGVAASLATDTRRSAVRIRCLPDLLDAHMSVGDPSQLVLFEDMMCSFRETKLRKCPQCSMPLPECVGHHGHIELPVPVMHTAPEAPDIVCMLLSMCCCVGARCCYRLHIDEHARRALFRCDRAKRMGMLRTLYKSRALCVSCSTACSATPGCEGARLGKDGSGTAAAALVKWSQKKQCAFVTADGREQAIGACELFDILSRIQEANARLLDDLGAQPLTAYMVRTVFVPSSKQCPRSITASDINATITKFTVPGCPRGRPVRVRESSRSKLSVRDAADASGARNNQVRVAPEQRETMRRNAIKNAETIERAHPLHRALACLVCRVFDCVCALRGPIANEDEQWHTLRGESLAAVDFLRQQCAQEIAALWYGAVDGFRQQGDSGGGGSSRQRHFPAVNIPFQHISEHFAERNIEPASALLFRLQIIFDLDGKPWSQAAMRACIRGLQPHGDIHGVSSASVKGILGGKEGLMRGVSGSAPTRGIRETGTQESSEPDVVSISFLSAMVSVTREVVTSLTLDRCKHLVRIRAVRSILYDEGDGASLTVDFRTCGDYETEFMELVRPGAVMFRRKVDAFDGVDGVPWTGDTIVINRMPTMSVHSFVPIAVRLVDCGRGTDSLRTRGYELIRDWPLNDEIELSMRVDIDLFKYLGFRVPSAQMDQLHMDCDGDQINGFQDQDNEVNGRNFVLAGGIRRSKVHGNNSVGLILDDLLAIYFLTHPATAVRWADALAIVSRASMPHEGAGPLHALVGMLDGPLRSWPFCGAERADLLETYIPGRAVFAAAVLHPDLCVPGVVGLGRRLLLPGPLRACHLGPGGRPDKNLIAASCHCLTRAQRDDFLYKLHVVAAGVREFGYAPVTIEVRDMAPQQCSWIHCDAHRYRKLRAKLRSAADARCEEARQRDLAHQRDLAAVFRDWDRRPVARMPAVRRADLLNGALMDASLCAQWEIRAVLARADIAARVKRYLRVNGAIRSGDIFLDGVPASRRVADAIAKGFVLDAFDRGEGPAARACNDREELVEFMAQNRAGERGAVSSPEPEPLPPLPAPSFVHERFDADAASSVVFQASRSLVNTYVQEGNAVMARLNRAQRVVRARYFKSPIERAGLRGLRWEGGMHHIIASGAKGSDQLACNLWGYVGQATPQGDYPTMSDGRHTTLASARVPFTLAHGGFVSNAYNEGVSAVGMRFLEGQGRSTGSTSLWKTGTEYRTMANTAIDCITTYTGALVDQVGQRIVMHTVGKTGFSCAHEHRNKVGPSIERVLGMPEDGTRYTETVRKSAEYLQAHMRQFPVLGGRLLLPYSSEVLLEVYRARDAEFRARLSCERDELLAALDEVTIDTARYGVHEVFIHAARVLLGPHVLGDRVDPRAYDVMLKRMRADIVQAYTHPFELEAMMVTMLRHMRVMQETLDFQRHTLVGGGPAGQMEKLLSMPAILSNGELLRLCEPAVPMLLCTVDTTEIAEESIRRIGDHFRWDPVSAYMFGPARIVDTEDEALAVQMRIAFAGAPGARDGRDRRAIQIPMAPPMIDPRLHVSFCQRLSAALNEGQGVRSGLVPRGRGGASFIVRACPSPDNRKPFTYIFVGAGRGGVWSRRACAAIRDVNLNGPDFVDRVVKIGPCDGSGRQQIGFALHVPPGEKTDAAHDERRIAKNIVRYTDVLRSVLELGIAQPGSITCNDIAVCARMFGISRAMHTIEMAIRQLVDAKKISISMSHIHVMAAMMCYSGRPAGFTFSSLPDQDRRVLASAQFSKQMRSLLSAAALGQEDILCNPSSGALIGRPPGVSQRRCNVPPVAICEDARSTALAEYDIDLSEMHRPATFAGMPEDDPWVDGPYAPNSPVYAPDSPVYAPSSPVYSNGMDFDDE